MTTHLHCTCTVLQNVDSKLGLCYRIIMEVTLRRERSLHWMRCVLHLIHNSFTGTHWWKPLPVCTYSLSPLPNIHWRHGGWIVSPKDTMAEILVSSRDQTSNPLVTERSALPPEPRSPQRSLISTKDSRGQMGTQNLEARSSISKQYLRESGEEAASKVSAGWEVLPGNGDERDQCSRQLQVRVFTSSLQSHTRRFKNAGMQNITILWGPWGVREMQN